MSKIKLPEPEYRPVRERSAIETREIEGASLHGGNVRVKHGSVVVYSYLGKKLKGSAVFVIRNGIEHAFRFDKFYQPRTLAHLARRCAEKVFCDD